MYLKNIKLHGFRNYRTIDINFSRNGAFFEGENGAGKTNILEAIYMLYTGRSQRNALKSEMVHFDMSNSAIEGTTATDKGPALVDNSIIFDRKKTLQMTSNGKKTSSFSEWFGTHAIISFSPDDIQLLQGSPVERRKFIDILISFFDKEYLNHIITYRKNHALRNHLLRNNMDDILCDIYEEKMAESGAEIVLKRTEIIEQLSREFIPIYQEISAQKDSVFFKYQPSFLSDLTGKKQWKEVFYTMLHDRRKKDMETGFSSRGPHRDDIVFFINEKNAGTFASQGQGRSIVLSFKMSGCTVLKKTTGKNPIVLFDDAVSELDGNRTERVLALVETLGQLFIASPRRTVPVHNAQDRFLVSNGSVSPL